MVARHHRLEANIDGEFFVESSCIDCTACRWIAPDTFDEVDELSRVYRQPKNAAERLRAEMALLACPVAAIGTENKHDYTDAFAAFPDLLEDGVYYTGYNSEKSYGASSYFIVRPRGNILVDSPRFTKQLVSRLEALGGVRYMFLSHCDDVADHARFRDHFGCERILHKADLHTGTRDIEIKIDGAEPVAFAPDVTLIPVPGHTRGSTCLLYADKFLFVGDHLGWEPDEDGIRGWRSVCWYDWDQLVASTERLLQYRFEWLLPGHGYPCHFPAARMAREIKACVAWMHGS